MSFSTLVLISLSTLTMSPSIVGANADDAAVQACEEAMAIEGQDPKYANADLAFLCKDTSHDAVQWQCVVDAMKGEGYRLSRALTHCGVKP